MVVLVLWSTKYLTPSRVYRISQPSGRGSSFCKLEGEVGVTGWTLQARGHVDRGLLDSPDRQTHSGG